MPTTGPASRPGDDAASDPAFDDAWRRADAVGGWLTPAQGRLLWDCARDLTEGARIVEIGSHQGRSTVVLGLAAASVGARVTAIDPFVEGAMFGGQSTRAKFEANIAAAGLQDVVDLMPMKSQDALVGWDQPIDLLYIDGKHDYWTVVDDLGWTEHLAPGALTLIHDSFCSVGVTSALLDHVLVRGRLRYLRRETTMAVFDRAVPSGADRKRLAAELPWFTRNVTIKAARRVHAAPVLRALGHDSPYDPY
ncbi:MAG: class I SAM-dependent methyltransferase [Candidatus Nanopelagicales bacterium]